MSTEDGAPGTRSSDRPSTAPVFRSGFVSLVGRPNAGKSTLLNRIIGSKVSIVSRHPQTTRSEIRGVRTTADSQMVFLDTPGLHRPRTPLGERTNARALGTLREVDVICQLVDATAPVGGGDRFVADHVLAVDTPAILVLNKTDATDAGMIAAQLERAASLGDYAEFVPVSAVTGEGVEVLLALIEERLSPGPHYYPDGMISDQPEAVLAAELLREKLLAVVRDELPHSIAVSVSEIDDTELGDGEPGVTAPEPVGLAPAESDAPAGDLRLRAEIRVERDSQKGIVIGKGGTVLRDAGTAARLELEALLGRRVHLETTVKVDRGWQRSASALDRLGF